MKLGTLLGSSRGIFVLAMLCGGVSHAQDKEGFALLETIRYKQIGSMDRKAGDDRFAKAIEKTGMFDVSPSFEPIMKDMHLAHIFASGNLEKMVIVRYDFEPVDETLKGRILNLGNKAYLVHSTDAQKRPVALFFEGFNQVEVVPYLIRINQTSTTAAYSSLKNHWFQFFISEARAEEPEKCKMSLEERVGEMKSFAGQALAAGWGCVKKVVGGIYGSFKSTVDILNGSFFSSVGGIVHVVKEVYEQVSTNLSGMFTALKAHPEVARDLVCSLLGGFLGDALIAGVAGLFTGGAGAALGAAKMAEKIAKVMETVQGVLSKLKTKVVDFAKNVALKVVEDEEKLNAYAHRAKESKETYDQMSEAAKKVKENGEKVADSVKECACHHMAHSTAQYAAPSRAPASEEAHQGGGAR